MPSCLSVLKQDLASSDDSYKEPVPNLEQIENLVADVDDDVESALRYDSDSDSDFEEFAEAQSSVTDLESAVS